MDRHDFELVARTVKAFPLIGKERLATMFAEAIAAGRGNSGFDRVKFLKQCGVASEQR